MTTGGETSKPWKLELFPEKLDRWIELCSPSSELRRIVRTWVLTRFDSPYRGMKQATGFTNLWSGKVPRSEDGQGNAVQCCCYIEELTHTVICESFATLSEPIE